MAHPSISSSDRIRELSEINADVPALLSSAGNAINALTGRPPAEAVNGSTNGDIDMSDGTEHAASSSEVQKEAFTKYTTAYFEGIQSIMARLRRQAYALEEAGIIASEAPTLASASHAEPPQRTIRPGMPQAARSQVEEPVRITNGGLGDLDVGYLNSRGNRVGLEKEAELAAEARLMLEKTLARSSKTDEHST